MIQWLGFYIASQKEFNVGKNVCKSEFESDDFHEFIMSGFGKTYEYLYIREYNVKPPLNKDLKLISYLKYDIYD